MMSETSNEILITPKDDFNIQEQCTNNTQAEEVNMKNIEKENNKKIRRKKRRKQSDPMVNSIAALVTANLNIISPEKYLNVDSIDNKTNIEENSRLSLAIDKQLNESLNKTDDAKPKRKSKLSLKNESLVSSPNLELDDDDVKPKKKRKSKLSLKSESVDDKLVLSPSPKSAKSKFKECSQQGNLNSFLKFTSPAKNNKLDEVKKEEVVVRDESNKLKVSMKLFSPKRKNKREKPKDKEKKTDAVVELEDSSNDLTKIEECHVNGDSNEIVAEIDDSLAIQNDTTKIEECHNDDSIEVVAEIEDSSSAIQNDITKVEECFINGDSIAALESEDSDDEVLSKKINRRLVEAETKDKKIENAENFKDVDEEILSEDKSKDDTTNEEVSEETKEVAYVETEVDEEVLNGEVADAETPEIVENLNDSKTTKISKTRLEKKIEIKMKKEAAKKRKEDKLNRKNEVEQKQPTLKKTLFTKKTNEETVQLDRILKKQSTEEILIDDVSKDETRNEEVSEEIVEIKIKENLNDSKTINLGKTTLEKKLEIKMKKEAAKKRKEEKLNRKNELKKNEVEQKQAKLKKTLFTNKTNEETVQLNEKLKKQSILETKDEPKQTRNEEIVEFKNLNDSKTTKNAKTKLEKKMEIKMKKEAAKKRKEEKLNCKNELEKNEVEHPKLKNSLFTKKTVQLKKESILEIEEDSNEVQTINLGKSPDAPKCDVFQFMMNSRNKSIGQNSPGKTIDSPTNVEEVEDKTKLSKRRKKLEEWSNKKGGTKRKLEEEAREVYAEKVLKSRAKRMKDMLQIDSDSSEFESNMKKRKRKRINLLRSSSDESDFEIKKKKKRIDLTEETNDGEMFEKINKSPKKMQGGLLNFVGVLKNENKIIIDESSNDSIDIKRKKRGRKPKIKVNSDESKKLDSESSSDICISKIRSKLKMKINISTLEIIESSLDGEEFEETVARRSIRAKPIQNYIEEEEEVKKKKKVEVKKVAPVFLKSAPRPKLDPIALEARNNFLHSGVPSSLKKSYEKQESLDDQEFEVFPTISHIQQKPDPLTPLWSLPNVNLNVKPPSILTPLTHDILQHGSITNTKKITTKRELHPPQPDQNCKLLLDKIKSENPDFPVYRTYRLLREKCCFSKPIIEPPKVKKRGRKKKKLDDSVIIIEPKINLAEQAMWTEKYKPKSALDIIGNHKSVMELKRWLEGWIEFSTEISTMKKRHRGSDSSDFEDGGNSSCSLRLPGNTMILEGVHGCGKTSAVYAVCCELGINVIELNASSKRTGKRLLLELQEATQSHQVRKKDTNSMTSFLNKKRDRNPPQESSVKSNKMCLLLIEDIDIVFEQDDGFISALNQLVNTSKRPIVLVTGNIDCPHLQKFTNLYPIVTFKPLPASLLSNWLQILCLIEGLHVDKYALAELLQSNRGDIRRSLLQLQYWALSGGDAFNKKSNNRDFNLSRIECSYEDEIIVGLEDGNVDWKYHQDCVQGTLNLGTTWWNLPKILNQTKELKDASDVLDAFSLTDTMRKTCGFDVETEPRLKSWQSDLQDTLNLRENMRCYDANLDCLDDVAHSLLDGYCEMYKTDDWSIDLAVPNIDQQRWRKQQTDCKRCYFEVMPLSCATDRTAFALDYFPILRTISRTEKVRSSNSNKRNNRFYNYLKTLDVNPNSTQIKTACDMLNV